MHRYLVGEVTVGVLSPADFAEDACRVTSSAVAGDMASLAVAEDMASMAVAEVASLAAF